MDMPAATITELLANHCLLSLIGDNLTGIPGTNLDSDYRDFLALRISSVLIHWISVEEHEAYRSARYYQWVETYGSGDSD